MLAHELSSSWHISCNQGNWARTPEFLRRMSIGADARGLFQSSGERRRRWGGFEQKTSKWPRYKKETDVAIFADDHFSNEASLCKFSKLAPGSRVGAGSCCKLRVSDSRCAWSSKLRVVPSLWWWFRRLRVPRSSNWKIRLTGAVQHGVAIGWDHAQNF